MLLETQIFDQQLLYCHYTIPLCARQQRKRAHFWNGIIPLEDHENHFQALRNMRPTDARSKLNVVQGSQRLPKPFVAPCADGLPRLAACRIITRLQYFRQVRLRHPVLSKDQSHLIFSHLFLEPNHLEPSASKSSSIIMATNSDIVRVGVDRPGEASGALSRSTSLTVNDRVSAIEGSY